MEGRDPPRPRQFARRTDKREGRDVDDDVGCLREHVPLELHKREIDLKYVPRVEFVLDRSLKRPNPIALAYFKHCCRLAVGLVLNRNTRSRSRSAVDTN